MSYPLPPPSYGASGASPKPARDDAREPLLAGPSNQSNSIFDQPDPGDVPDDFKYGTTVSDSSPEIRKAFVRKVYTILLCQIFATVVVGGALFVQKGVAFWVQTHTWALFVLPIATVVNFAILLWKRHAHPLNLVLLGTFTLLEAFSVGVGIAFNDDVIVIQALLITLGVFIGLTVFTFQSKYDFEGMGPFLFGGLMALFMTALVNMLIPFNETWDLIYAIGGCLIFSGYIVYDTFMINARHSPDEFIMGALSLYLDFLNLFVFILRLLNNINDR
ncbi:UPF0005-domain-containing protein [Mycena vitilis]|nr:UPF0005-domain-containing protein [Mycena vitilis]